jgi:hypothetical protein
MATQTPKYKLNKQGQEDYYNVDVLNGNMDIIDDVLGDHSSLLAQLADDYTKQIPYAVTGGVANSYVVNSPTIIALLEGIAISIKVHAASTAASTLNWNGTGAKNIKKANGGNVTNLAAGGIYTLRYDGANFILQGEGASGNATASDLLLDKTASTDAGDIVGTMPNRGSVGTQSLTTEGAEYTIPAGYHNGLGKVKAVITGLIASVIKAGTTVGGILGTFTADATATAAQMLSGVTAYVNGNKVTGNIPIGGNDEYQGWVRGNVSVAPELYRAHFWIPTRKYYQETANNSNQGVFVDDTNYIPANILSGKSIFGMSGTAKRVATGTVGTGGSAPFFTVQGGGSLNFNFITVSGLTFTPSVIIATATYNTDFTSVSIHKYTSHYGGYRCHMTYIKNNVSNYTYEAVPDANYYVTSTGFQLPVMGGGVTYTWTAIE